MLTWEAKYHEDLSCYVKAEDDVNTYLFSTHSVDRLFERNTNLHTIGDLEKPIRRVAKCLRYWRTDNWVMKHPFGTRLLVHDVDIKMLYIITCNLTHYDIISTYNEYHQAYDNTQGTPELWISLRK